MKHKNPRKLYKSKMPPPLEEGRKVVISVVF